MKKRLAALVLALAVLLPCAAAGAGTDLPYDTYNYDYWGNVMLCPAAYVPSGFLSGADLLYQGGPVGAFKTPQDMVVSPDGEVYIADTGNNRVVVLEKDLKTVRKIITGFERDGREETFNAPYGVAVSNSGQLYIADSRNRRIVVLNADGSFDRTVENPQSDVLADNYVFTPLKVSVDYADRVYCIAQNMFEGIMVFASEGNFTGFFGTIEVKISLWEKFWRKIATKEERSKQQLFIPTEFTGIDIDDEGFVYATNVDTDGVQAVRRLNPRGQDVVKKGTFNSLAGDVSFAGTTTYAGPSRITDVVYRGRGIYSVLDSKRGRIFTYDHEGNLLYIFGGKGTQEGTFNTPVAIEYLDGSILVLDANLGKIMRFGVTEYGSLINEAVGLRFDGDEALAVPLWEEVLRLDENNELANSGIGKAYLSAGDNGKAMTYLRRGMNRTYYSVAYKRYRNEVLKQNLGFILTGVIMLIALLIVLQKTVLKKFSAKRKEKAKRDLSGSAGGNALFSREKWQYLFYTAGHPSDGYYWIRHQERGSVKIAVLLVVVFGLTFSLNRIYASFIVNDINPRTVNSVTELLGVIVLFFMICAGNWSITCLMNGEGRFKDIVIAVGYGFLPVIAGLVLGTVFSQFLAENEEAFYLIIVGIGIAYGVIMMLIGIMQVHHYTLGKTLLTLFLTFVAVLIIIFILLLVFNFITQVVTFIRSVYTELVFRG